MKNLFALILGAGFLTLAACSGGSGGSGGGITPSTPAPNVTPTPTTVPVSYTVKLAYVGIGTSANQQIPSYASKRTAQSGAATPPPIVIINGCAAPCLLNGSTGAVYTVVDPVPSSSPTISLTTTDSTVAFAPTPSPGPSATPYPLPSGAIGESFVNSTPGPTDTSALVQSNSTTATTTVGAPVSASAIVTIVRYPAAILACDSTDLRNSPASGVFPGLAWNGTTMVPTTTPSTSDIYVSGPASICNGDMGALATSESVVTLHFPYGGNLVSNLANFYDLTATEWANTQTSSTLAEIQTIAPDGIGDYQDVFFKTSGGIIVKANVSQALEGFEIYYQVSGSSVDGF